MENPQYCKLCLVTDVKMFSINTPSILEAYSQLVHMDFCEDYEQYICYICVSLLHKYQEFRSKCITAINVLSSINVDHSKIAKESIQNVDRKLYNLESKLAHCQTKIILSINDQYEQEDCNTIHEQLFINGIKSEIDVELGRPENDLETDASVLNNDLQNKNTSLLNEIILESDDYVSDEIDNDNVPKKRKKRKSETKRKKMKKAESINEIDLEQNDFSDIDDEPLSRSSKKSKENDHSNKTLRKEVSETIKKTSGPKFNASYFEDYATVKLLTPEDAKKEVLLRKESSNYKNCAYKCDLCYRGYEVKTTYNNHMKKHSLEYGSWECEYCHVRFLAKKFLYKHQFSSHKRKFYCKICPYVCFSNYQAKTHISLHKGKKYPCKDCGELFSMPNSLLMHKRVKHVAECACALCGSMFATQRGLYAHKMLLHRQENVEITGPKCEECDVQFATETAFKRHLVLSSKHTVSNGCEFCGERFSNEEALKIHLKVHSRKNINRRYCVKFPAACTICDKSLTNRKEYKNHMTSQHPHSKTALKIDAEEQMQFVCEVCGMGFKKKCFLQYHQRKHTGERPYECGECGKTFRFPGALSTHRGAHSSSRVHQCHMCQKVFVYKSALNKHVKAHLGIRPHKCTFCDKSFPNPSDVKVHMKYVHYKVPWPKRDRTKRNATEQSAVL